ncbi:MAG: excinuclease ABC subunit UvrA [Gammaproteobacteria bacterium]
MDNEIKIKGARTHNLKNIDLNLPKNNLITITGLSGSGKSSLAFDTIFAEGQRRYVESLSAYARQFLSMVDKPDVDKIEGLSPAISIEQKSTSHNPRSTVGTVTEIYDYLRLLYARIGEPRCPEHHVSLDAMSPGDMYQKLIKVSEKQIVLIMAPIVRGQKGEHIKIIESYSKQGFSRIRVNGEIHKISEISKHMIGHIIDSKKKNNIEIIVDRVEINNANKLRIIESFNAASEISEGIIYINQINNGNEHIFSTKHACPHCGYSISKLEPKLFSFNSPAGACQRCDGLGMDEFFDENKIIENPELNLRNGAIAGWDEKNYLYFSMLDSLAAHFSIDIDQSYYKLPKHFRNILFYGTDENVEFKLVKLNKKTKKFINSSEVRSWEGICNIFERNYNNAFRFSVKRYYEKFLTESICRECDGTRLNIPARNVYIGEKSISEITDMNVEEAIKFFNHLELDSMRKKISEKIIFEISSRLKFLNNVGLKYLTLSRSAETLSGGESQRIRLASQIGSGLTGVMYVLDEPSIGLHQRDNDRLLKTLKNLRDLGNTVIVVEHDEDTILSSDHIVDIGPNAGVHGGEVVFSGKPSLLKSVSSHTSDFISGRNIIEIPKERLRPSKKWISISKAHANNLNEIDVKIPLGLLTCITGVSGSGKSSLINNVLYSSIVNKLLDNNEGFVDCEKITGIDYIDKIIDIDQSPIGRTPRSNPITYTGIFSLIREEFAKKPESKSRGYTPGRFSFNVKGKNNGVCPHCDGQGQIKVEMHFLSDVYVQCEKCNGNRYNDETLEIKLNNKNISDVLNMTVQEALSFFENYPKISKKLSILMEVGLGYIKLGQSAITLSGGEAQRIKLAKELIRPDTGHTLYVLDEPTTGLHNYDVKNLLQVLSKLKQKGNTLIIIEHNLDVIKTADWIVDLGPEGGNGGGMVIGFGTPEELASNKKSYTGKYLKEKL